MMIFLCETLATFTEAYLGYTFLCGFETKDKEKQKLVFVTILTVIGVCANFVRLYSSGTTIMAAGFLVVTSNWLNRNGWIKNMSICAFYFMLIYAVDCLTMIAQSIWVGNPHLPRSLVQEYSYMRCLFLIISKINLVALCLLLKLTARRLQIPFRMFAGFPAVAGIVVFLLTRKTFQGVNADIMMKWLLALAVFIFCLFFFSTFSAYQKEMKEHQIMAMKNEMLMEQYTQLMELDHEKRKLYHDLHNHLMVLYEMVKGNEKEQILSYIEGLAEPVSEMRQVSWTGNQIVDVILNVYKTKAERDHILLEIDSDQIAFTGKKDQDLCTIFGNLLENALEAEQKEEPEKRKIRIRIRQFEEILLIRVENYAEVMPVWRGKQPITTKKDSSAHGLGLRNVEETVETYGGSFTCKWEDSLFSVEITFFNSREKNFEDKNKGFGDNQLK